MKYPHQGRWFLALVDGHPCYQGRVEGPKHKWGKAGWGVEFYSFLTGEPDGIIRFLDKAEAAKSYRFYPSAKAMRAAYDEMVETRKQMKQAAYEAMGVQ